MSVKLLPEHHLEVLSLKGGCTGASESTLVKMQHLLEITCHGLFLNLQFIQILTLHLHLVQTSLSHFSPCFLIVPSSSLQDRSVLDLDTITLICGNVILLYTCIL